MGDLCGGFLQLWPFIVIVGSGCRERERAGFSGIALAAIAVINEIRVTNVQLVNGNLLSFTFESETGRTYRIERSVSMMDSPWETAGNIVATGTSTTWTVSAPTLPVQSRFFYRARLLP